MDHSGRVYVEFLRNSPLSGTRCYDVEPHSENWDTEAPYTNQAGYSHVRLVSRFSLFRKYFSEFY